MVSKTLSAGSPIEAKCTKCQNVTNHIIIAMIGDLPALVQCNTCEGRHKFRAPSVAKAKSLKTTTQSATTSKRSTKKDPADSAREKWETLQLSLKAGQAKPYTMETAYHNNDIIQHSTFGLGQVQRFVSTRKVEILFQSGLKMLRCK